MAASEKYSHTPPEIAEMLGVGHEKVLTWIRNGELVTSSIRRTEAGLALARTDSAMMAIQRGRPSFGTHRQPGSTQSRNVGRVER